MAWLPDDFVHPLRLDVGTAGHHLRPITEADTPIDYPAVMGSQPRLWSLFGSMWGWPTSDMTYEHDRADLARHEREIEADESFNYALLDAEEAALLGCLYIDPPETTSRSRAASASSAGGSSTSSSAPLSPRRSTPWFLHGSRRHGRSTPSASRCRPSCVE